MILSRIRPNDNLSRLPFSIPFPLLLNFLVTRSESVKNQTSAHLFTSTNQLPSSKVSHHLVSPKSKKVHPDQIVQQQPRPQSIYARNFPRPLNSESSRLLPISPIRNYVHSRDCFQNIFNSILQPESNYSRILELFWGMRKVWEWQWGRMRME